MGIVLLSINPIYLVHNNPACNEQMDFDTVPHHIPMSVRPTTSFPMGICQRSRASGEGLRE